MLWPKKNSDKEFYNEKKFLWLENSPPPPPITFLMVRPLARMLQFSLQNGCTVVHEIQKEHDVFHG